MIMIIDEPEFDEIVDIVYTGMKNNDIEKIEIGYLTKCIRAVFDLPPDLAHIAACAAKKKYTGDR